MSDDPETVEFDETVSLALADSVQPPVTGPPPAIKAQLLARVMESEPAGFSFRFEGDADWMPHPVPGIRMKVLAVNQASRYVTVLLDVAPGTRVPPHRHDGAEECYVISGALQTFGRRLGPGDFLHADPGTDHDEVWTDVGCRVLLVVPPDDAPR
jgi:anti-sigma factor ChrR (cupin superfamily)